MEVSEPAPGETCARPLTFRFMFSHDVTQKLCGKPAVEVIEVTIARQLVRIPRCAECARISPIRG